MTGISISGIGVVSAVGDGAERSWDSLMRGDSGIGEIISYSTSALRTTIGAEMRTFNPLEYMSRRGLRFTTRSDQLAVAGAISAVRDTATGGSSSEPSPQATSHYDPDRIGVFVGGAKEISNPDHLLAGALSAKDENGAVDIRLLGERASSAFYPLFYVEGLQSASLFHISNAMGARGPNNYFHGTSDVGVVALRAAVRSIVEGHADVAIVGAFDDAASWWSMSKTDGLGILARSGPDPRTVFRPFERRRLGSVLGDGAVFVVLERASAVRARGGRSYAEVGGIGMTRDPGYISPDPTGAALTAAISAAISRTKAVTSDVDAVIAHGSATHQGDASEVRALRKVFHVSAPKVTSVKPNFGHLVAASGMLNVVTAALACYNDAVPHTLNLDEIASDCDGVQHVQGRPHYGTVRSAIAVARGFHGQQSAVVVQQSSKKAAQ